MSQHVRFTALAAILFVTSYLGVSWVIAGTPMPSLSLRSGQPDTHLGADGNPARDKLRIMALQASNAYALTPCNGATKAALIDAVSSYAKAWYDMMGCGSNGCDYSKLNATAAAFSTPLDLQVRDAIGAAFDKPGISIEDFPSPLHTNIAMLVRGRGAPATACPRMGVQTIRLTRAPVLFPRGETPPIFG